MSNHGQSHLIMFNHLCSPFFKTKHFTISSTFNHHYLTNHGSSKYRLLVSFSQILQKNADEFLSCSTSLHILVGFNEPPQIFQTSPVAQSPSGPSASSSVGSKSSAGRSASTRTPCSTSMAVAARAPGGRWRSLRRRWVVVTLRLLKQKLHLFNIAMEAIWSHSIPFYRC